MIDLSFLTEEEQKTIAAVLKRDAELKKAEAKRIQDLKKTVADKSKLKYLTGEWFYETKHLRHQEYVHASDIIRASMRRTSKPQTVVEDSHTVSEKSSFVTSKKGEAFILPAHCTFDEEPVSLHSTEGNQIHNLHETLSDAPKVELPLPMKVRSNPFNSENTFEENKQQLVDKEPENLTLSQNQSSDENPVISALTRLSLRTMSSSKSVENLNTKTALSLSNCNTMKSSFSVQSLQQGKYQAEWDNPLGNTWKSSSSISKSSRSSRMASMSSISSSTSTIFLLDTEVQGSIQFAVNYIQKVEEFQVFVVHCRGLAVAETKKNSSDPYVKCYLVPDKTQLGKRKTTVKKKTLNPTYNEVLKFKINLEELRKQSLNVSVWHNGLFGRNSFLGDVDLDLSEWDFNNTEINEYALKAQVPKEIFGRLDLGLNENCGKMRVALKFVLQTVKSKKNKRAEAGELLIWVKDCKDLPQVRGVITNPFLKCTVLPDMSRKSRQKTRVVKKTANPLFNHTMMYDGFKPEDLGEACAEITVWDRNRLHNHFIGGARLGPGTVLCMNATLIPKADITEAADTVTLAYDNLILHAVCDEFGFRQFSAEEISFIHKFVDVMRPLASALNILQGEKNVFLGYLAPTIVQLQNDMNDLLEESTKPTAAQGLITYRPLILNILQSLKTRVEAVLEKKEHILSAMLLPKFKLNWVDDEEKRLVYRVMLKRELLTSNSYDSETQNSDQSEPSGDTDKDPTASFFSLTKTLRISKKVKQRLA